MNNYETLRAKYSEQKVGETVHDVEATDPTHQDMNAADNDVTIEQAFAPVEPIGKVADSEANPDLFQAQDGDAPNHEGNHCDEWIDEQPTSTDEVDCSESQNDCLDTDNYQVEKDESVRMLADLNRDIMQTNASLEAVLHAIETQKSEIQALRQVIARCDSSAEQMKRLSGNFEELKQNVARQEKANVDILRDSKNFQASVRDQMQRELDGYHKLHSSSAYAPILIEIANLYITTQKAISYVADEKIREHFNDLVLESISELLTDQGVDIHSTEVGQTRSIRTCKTRKTIPTGDKTLHGLVAASNHPSFSLGNLVLIKESIDTYVYDEALDSHEDENITPATAELTE